MSTFKFNIPLLRSEMAEEYLKLEDTIGYTMRVLLEKAITKHLGKLPYMGYFVDAYMEGWMYDEDCMQEELDAKNAQIDLKKTLTRMLEVYPETEMYEPSKGDMVDAIYLNPDFIFYKGTFYMNEPCLPSKLMDCVVEKEEVPQIRWVSRGSHGFETKFIEIKPKGGIEDNYNDDIKPMHEELVKMIHSQESAISILHGEPGTGKTCYIRNLIASNPDVNFYWLDASMFDFISTSEFIQFIAGCKNSVFILEDSEIILKSREDGGNSAMQSLLNLADGMLGDALQLKFICTFNTEMVNIDKAIKRKGRMKIDYTFAPLCADKVKKIFDKDGIEYEESDIKAMPLCEIYNFHKENKFNENTKRKKIGF